MPKKALKSDGKWYFFGVAGELGFLIAIPALIGAFGGRYLDQKFDTSPLFLLIGILLSITMATVGIVRKLALVNRTIEDEIKNTEKDQE